MKKKIKRFISPMEGVIEEWNSRWHARNEELGDLVEDKHIRDYLKKTLYDAGIPKIEIERDNDAVCIYLHCARPNVVFGRGSEEIKKIEAHLVKIIGRPVDLRIIEVRNVDANAQIVAENITQQLEKCIGLHQAMKNSADRAMCAEPKVSRSSVLAAWTVLRSVLSVIKTVPSPCGPFALTSTTGLL